VRLLVPSALTILATQTAVACRDRRTQIAINNLLNSVQGPGSADHLRHTTPTNLPKSVIRAVFMYALIDLMFAA